MQNDLFRLHGRAALVAGAASGIGRSAALGLAAAGAAVVCADINKTGSEIVASEIRDQGGQADALELDITNERSIASTLQHIQEQHRQIHILVSTPAVNVRKPLLDYTAAEFDRVIGLNLKGTLLIAQAVGRMMREARGGSIILFLHSLRHRRARPGRLRRN